MIQKKNLLGADEATEVCNFDFFSWKTLLSLSDVFMECRRVPMLGTFLFYFVETYTAVPSYLEVPPAPLSCEYIEFGMPSVKHLRTSQETWS